MIANTIEIHKAKFDNIEFCEFDRSRPGRLMKFCVYLHPVGYYWSVMIVENLTTFRAGKTGQTHYRAHILSRKQNPVLKFLTLKD